MAGPNPGALIIHGACHHPACYDLFGRELEAAEFEVYTPRLASFGTAVVSEIVEDDVMVIHRAIQPLFASGKQVILSEYGGKPV
jgi:hypothetical protein